MTTAQLQFKNPQGSAEKQIYSWAQGLIAALRKGLTLNAATDLTGILPIANGGTAQATAPAARAATGLNVESGTGQGDAAYTILATDRFVFTNAAFTAPRTWSLPAANTVNPGAPLVVADVAGGVSSTNTLSLAPNGTDKIDGSNTTQVALNAAFQLILLWSDGVANWKTSGKLPQPAAALPSTPTYQYLLSGTAATYTRPANCRMIRVRMIGGGGGGGGSTGAGAAGTDTIFNSIHAAHGGGGAANGSSTPGAGGTGGAGSANLRLPGNSGWVAGTSGRGSNGAPGLFGMGAGAVNNSTGNGGAGGPNTGGGGAGGTEASQTGGGGSGEYVELVITSPSATYTYTIGGGGAGGTGTQAGGAGGSGLIIVEEYY